MAESLSSEDVILTPMMDGTGMLRSLESEFYFALHATRVAVWKLLESVEAKAARDLADRNAMDFEAPSVEAADADVAVPPKDFKAEALMAGGGPNE